MIIMIAGEKGGTGKSPLAYITASYFGFNLYSNEATINEAYYEKTKTFKPEYKKVGGLKVKIPKELPIVENTVYDFAGDISTSVIEVAKHADIIIIPSTDEEDSIFKSANAMFNLGMVCKDDSKFILVATRVTDNKDDKDTALIFQNVDMIVNKKFAKEIGRDYEDLKPEERVSFKSFKIRENKMFRFLRNEKLNMSDVDTKLSGLHRKNWNNVIVETRQFLKYIEKQIAKK